VFRGLKPVNWCFDCGSALAEAEVEYADKTDPAIDVAFPISSDDRGLLAQAFNIAVNELPHHTKTVIWTTTPWTIVSNQALNVHPDVDYVLISIHHPLFNNVGFVLAKALYENNLNRWNIQESDYRVIATCKGIALNTLRFKHPLSEVHEGYNRFSPVYMADYVTTDSGTGVVHCAPAYGRFRHC
jgi:isoleucyl-tRNA synthetase